MKRELLLHFSGRSLRIQLVDGVKAEELRANLKPGDWVPDEQGWAAELEAVHQAFLANTSRFVKSHGTYLFLSPWNFVGYEFRDVPPESPSVEQQYQHFINTMIGLCKREHDPDHDAPWRQGES